MIDETFDSIKKSIFPWIKVTLTDETVSQEKVVELTGKDSPINFKWLGDLSVFYVIDRGESFEILMKRHVPEDISEEELLLIALSNLTEKVQFKLIESKFGGFGLIAGGDFEASSVLVNELWIQISEELSDNLIVTIPAKDIVLVSPESDSKLIEGMVNLSKEIFKGGERLLSKKIFRYIRDSRSWEVFETV